MSDGLRQVTGLDYRLARIMRHSGCVSGLAWLMGW